MFTQPLPAELKLVDAQDTQTIRPRFASAGDPIMCKEWDLGAPEVRVTYNPLPNTDGVSDGPGFLGARTVTLDLAILGGQSLDDGEFHDAYWYQERLTGFTNPQRRPNLTVSRFGGQYAGQTWTLPLRGNPYSITYGSRAGALLELQLSFTAPTGLLEGPLQSVTSTSAGDNLGGLTFPFSFPVDFGAGGFTNPRTTITVGGNAATSPIVYIVGPCTDPRLVTEDGEIFSFVGLTLASGESVQIDMAAGTVLLARNGTNTVAAADSIYHLINFAESTFWRWAPGPHYVRYYASGGSAIIQWRDRLLSI